MTEDPSHFSRRDLLTGVFQRFREVIAPNNTSSLPDPKLRVQADGDFSSNRYPQAAENYEKHLLGQPHDLDARRRLALCLYRQEKFAQCRMECGRVLYEKKDDDFAALLLGLANLRMDRTEKAVDALQRFIGDTESKELVETLIIKLSSAEGNTNSDAIQSLEPLLILPQKSQETAKSEAAPSSDPASS